MALALPDAGLGLCFGALRLIDRLPELAAFVLVASTFGVNARQGLLLLVTALLLLVTALL